MKSNQCYSLLSLMRLVAKQYNDAFVLCEVNDVGDQVAAILNFDLEYENLLDDFYER